MKTKMMIGGKEQMKATDNRLAAGYTGYLKLWDPNNVKDSLTLEFEMAIDNSGPIFIVKSDGAGQAYALSSQVSVEPLKVDFGDRSRFRANVWYYPKFDQLQVSIATHQ